MNPCMRCQGKDPDCVRCLGEADEYLASQVFGMRVGFIYALFVGGWLLAVMIAWPHSH